MAISRWTQLGRHLTEGASPFWYSVLPVALCLGVPSIWFDLPDAFRYAGLFLQIAGLLVVGYALGETLSSFKQASVLSRMRNWLTTFVDYLERPKKAKHVTVELQGVAAFGLGGSLSSATLHNATPTLEEKVDRIIKDFEKLRARVEVVDRNASQRIDDVRRHFEGEVQGLREIDEQIREGIKVQAVGDWDREVIGLVWLAFGTLFAGIPDELSRLVHAFS